MALYVFFGQKKQSDWPQKCCNNLVLLITPHRLKNFPRCEMEIYSLEYTLPDSIMVHTFCVKIWNVRGISE